MLLPYQQTDDKNLTLLQNRWKPILDTVIKVPLNAGLLLEAVVLASGTNVVNHRLGRKLQGYIVVLKSANVSVYDTQLLNQTPDLTLQLVSSGPAAISLWVF